MSTGFLIENIARPRVTGGASRYAALLGALAALSWMPLLTGCERDSSGTEPGADIDLDAGALHAHELPSGHELADCMYASPLAIESNGESFVIAAEGGRLTALNVEDGTARWMVELPAPQQERAWIVATPVVVGHRLVVAFQRTAGAGRGRVSHHAAVLDLDARALDADFPELTLRASQALPSGERVEFSAENAVSRAALAHADVPDGALGLVYVSFGNSRDIQPWHGWVFELDLDAWRSQGAPGAVSGVLLTSADADCGPAGESGSRDMRCGAGVWAPSGPKVVQRPGGFELLVPTGNGLLDPTRGAYAHSLLRAARGLQFDPACDRAACEGFDIHDPSPACMQSCRDLFMPRMPAGAELLGPDDGTCDGKTLLECYAALDWDLGANSPARVDLPSGRSVIALPAKDGAVYLIDAEHLGTLYDRVQVAEPCGTREDRCSADWAGMLVTEPLVFERDGDVPLVLVPSFEFDHTHPAGVTALRIDDDGEGPRFTRVWQTPSPEAAAATSLFRMQPSRLAAMQLGGEPYAFVVSVDKANGGRLLGMRVLDGALAVDLPLRGPGQRFVQPLVMNGRIYVPSCQSDSGPSEIEVFEITAPTP